MTAKESCGLGRHRNGDRAALRIAPLRAARSPSRVAFVCGVALCLAADFVLARQLLPNSDSVQSYNEMIAIRAGDPLLHHWALATDNFLLTDLLPMMVGSLLLGPAPRLVFLVPFVVFAAMLLASLLLVRTVLGTRDDRWVAFGGVLLLLGVPYGLVYNFFFWSDFHVATVTTCLYAVLAVAPALSGRRLGPWRLLPFTALVFAAAFSDPLADGLLVGPICLLAGLRAWLARVFRPDDWLIASCAGAGAAAAALVAHELAGTGLVFVTLPSVTLALVPTATDAIRDGRALFAAWQVLFTARAVLIATLPLHTPIAFARLLTALAVGVLAVLVLWRMPRSPRAGVVQLLVLGGLSVAILAAMSPTFAAAVTAGPDAPGAAVRFAVPSYVFFCLAAAMECVGSIQRDRLVAIGLCFGVLHAAGATVATLRAARSPPGICSGPDAGLAAWLTDHHLTYGIGDYWDTQLVDAMTGGKVLADPAVNVEGRLRLSVWLTDTSRFRPDHPPQFAIIRPYGLFRVDLAAVIATYGKPVSITEVAHQFFVARLRAPSP